VGDAFGNDVVEMMRSDHPLTPATSGACARALCRSVSVSVCLSLSVCLFLSFSHTLTRSLSLKASKQLISYF
jgi:hypothetical protein